MEYNKLVEAVHSKCLRYRRIDVLVASYEFKKFWLEHEQDRDKLIALINDLEIKKIRKMVLHTDLENMTLRELRLEASKWHMKYYAQLETEALRAELINARDRRNGKE